MQSEQDSDLDAGTLKMFIAIMYLLYESDGGVILGQIQVTRTDISGLLIIAPAVHGDERGFFMETYNQNDMAEAGIDAVFVQDNQSKSIKGVLRGLHYQKQFPQGKLVRVIKGAVYDVAVDLRPGSSTYGNWKGTVLSEDNKLQMYIPAGFAHGFLVMSDEAEFVYKVTDFYHPGDEGGIAWNDPEIGIEWPGLTGEYPGTADCSTYRMKDGTQLLMSDKDREWKGLSETMSQE